MKSRIVAAALVALAVSGATGCAPQPEPAPTASAGFATDAEAFAAAEKTYRLYVDALNQVDLSDPETFEEVYRWTTGDANAGERKSLTQMHADGWNVNGSTLVLSVVPDNLSSTSPSSVVVLACTNVAAVDVTDADGQSVVSTERPAVQSVRVELDSVSGAEFGFLISSLEGGSHTCG